MWVVLIKIVYLGCSNPFLKYCYEKDIPILLQSCSFSLQAQTDLTPFLKAIDANAAQYGTIAQTIWGYAEMGYQETKSSALLQETLAAEGFVIEKGIAGIPTAFSATYGTDGPVIAILGEYDALPGLSQITSPTKSITTPVLVMVVDIIYLVQHRQLQQLP